MDNPPFINNSIVLQKELQKLRIIRKMEKVKRKRNYQLSKSDKRLIYKKTDGKCHICGISLSIDKFEADHIKAHSQEGNNSVENFLPACKTCNNYRWHYLPLEIQWIFKIGVWARTEIEKNTTTGSLISKQFAIHETKREKRRIKPRVV